MTLFPPNHFALSLHSSSPQLGLGLTNFDAIWRSQTWELDREISNVLHSKLLEFISPQTWQELAFLVVDQGPGSFTSTRLGMVTARTLAQQFELPLFALSSLEAWVWSQRQRKPEVFLFATQMNATQGKLYGAVYQFVNDNSPLIAWVPDALFSPEDWQTILGGLPSGYVLIEAPRLMGEIVIALLELAYLQWQKGDRPHWSQALPFYG